MYTTDINHSTFYNMIEAVRVEVIWINMNETKLKKKHYYAFNNGLLEYVFEIHSM